MQTKYEIYDYHIRNSCGVMRHCHHDNPQDEDIKASKLIANERNPRRSMYQKQQNKGIAQVFNHYL